MTQTLSYNTAAAGWHDRIGALGYPAAYQTAINTLCPPQLNVRRLMDAGCGAGDFAQAYLDLRRAPDVLTLLDPAAAMLHEAAARLEGAAPETALLPIKLADLPPYPSQDLILCAHVIDHCPDPVQAIRTLGYAMAPRGAMILIVTKPHWCTWITRRLWRHHSYSPDQMLQAIVAAGLVCRRDIGFAAGPPHRTSHAYLVTHTQPEILL
ncbi:MAG: class I SAM-dependent methyltransferase [Paracoccaceae bacterium]